MADRWNLISHIRMCVDVSKHIQTVYAHIYCDILCRDVNGAMTIFIHDSFRCGYDHLHRFKILDGFSMQFIATIIRHSCGRISMWQCVRTIHRQKIVMAHLEYSQTKHIIYVKFRYSNHTLLDIRWSHIPM